MNTKISGFFLVIILKFNFSLPSASFGLWTFLNYVPTSIEVYLYLYASHCFIGPEERREEQNKTDIFVKNIFSISEI